jgi:hypothetical protein
MPEPVTMVLVGAAAWAWLKGRQTSTAAGIVLPGAPGVVTPPGTITPSGQPVPDTSQNPPPNVPQPISVGASGTGPDAPLATNTGNTNGVPIGAVIATDANITVIPADLVAILDDQSALMFREYVALHPDQFQVFLDRYAKNIELRDDMLFHAITDPPTGGYQLTPDMLIGLGSAGYKVIQGLNGVAAGNYGDLFGVSATVAGKIPGLDSNFVKSLQGLALGYRAFTQLTTFADIQAIAAANGVGVLDVTSSMLTSGAAGVYDTAGNLVSVAETPIVAGAFAGMPIASLGGALMAVGLIVDIGFTIAGDAPDIQKAIDVVLDVASLVCLFIPVIGWVIALVIQVVKFIIDLFGSDLFGGGMSHQQREMLETARYSENISPMYPQLAAAYTPRELWGLVVSWGSGYCGGVHIIAMSVALKLRAGDVIMVGGAPYTIQHDAAVEAYYGDGTSILLSPGRQPCYWLASGPFAQMTDDEQAWAMAKYGSTNGFVAEAQAGIREDLKTQFNSPTVNILMARTQTMKTFIDHGFTLDQIDQVAQEYRVQPHLADLAHAYGFDDWQHFFAFVVNDEWVGFSLSTTHGTLHDFALANGFQSMFEFRTAALATYETAWNAMHGALAWAQAEAAALAQMAADAAAQQAYQQASSSAP